VKPKNEFAFPQLEAERLTWWGHGMTLRDYFAAKAMQGLLTSHGVALSAEETSKISYNIADRMLAEREVGYESGANRPQAAK
jgi:hypothetical protein